MPTTAPFELFTSYVGIADENARSTFLFQHPALLSPSVEKEVAIALEKSPPERQRDLKPALDALERTREILESQPGAYPVGLGPVEELFDRQRKGEISLETAAALAAEPEVSDSLSAVYVDALCRLSFRGAYEGQWESPLRLHAILLSSVAALPDTPDTRAMKNQVEGDWIDIASVALNQVPDGRIYRSAMAAGERTVQRAKETNDRALLGDTLHRLGTLNLDPYTAGRTTTNYNLQVRLWLQGLSDAIRKQVFFGDTKQADMPAPIDALKLAAQYYEQAAESRDGAKKGLSLKALVQATFWQKIVGVTIDADQVRARAVEALALLDPAEHQAHIVELRNIIGAVSPKAGQGATARDTAHAYSADTDVIDAERLPELVRQLGAAPAMHLVNQTLADIEDSDPHRGLELAVAARPFMVALGSEPMLTALLQHELRLVRRTYAPEPLPTSKDDHVAKLSSTVLVLSKQEGWKPERLAASLLLLAMNSSPTNDESLGLQLLDRARRAAPDLAHAHDDAFLFLEALLWLGAGVNEVNAKHPAAAIRSYGAALGRFVSLGLWDAATDCLNRIHDQAGGSEQAIGTEVLGALMPHAAALQLRGSATITELVQRSCKRAMTAMGLTGINPEAANALLQLAKGLLFDRALASGTAGDWQPDEQGKALLEEIRRLEQQVPQSNAVVTLGDPALEEEALLLTGYAGENVAGQGAGPAERLVNLRRRFDRGIVEKLAAAGAATFSLLMTDDVQKALDERTVLLNVYLGAIHGVTAVYAMLFTGDEVLMNVTSHGFPDSSVELTVQGRAIAMSPFALQVQSVRSELLEDPGPGVVSAEAGKKLDGLVRGYLGYLVESLQKLRAEGKDHLCVVPHGPLHYFPWHLLGAPDQPIGENWIVTALPTIGMLTSHTTPAPGRVRDVTLSAIAVGFKGKNAYDLPPIPEAVTECRHIAKTMGVKPILDAAATEESLLRALESSRMVHLATHGAHNVDAPAFQHVYLTPGRTSDGRLHAHEMLAADLRGLELVTLSACETALGRFDMSDNPQGIPACLLLGGVSTIIGSLWPAETNASEHFFTTLYGEIKNGAGRLDAFAAAQRDTRAHYPDYRDWGAFYYIGKWN